MRIISTLFFVFLINISIAQIKKDVIVEYGTISQVDSIDANLYFSNSSRIGYKYLFNIFHLRIITARKDSLTIGLVYNINNYDNSLIILKKLLGRPVEFTLSEFIPSESDFPKMANCNYKTGLYSPARNSFLFKSDYKSILRVLDFSPIDSSAWNKLKELYQ